ncbi:DUF6602 domain-containing protein [uncultured Paracoccus sp.]|uniref:DUF6602 domain-containing protein n=1 Tax=uncultured Paracoccus sp. TaxID=189685 RepID=UPI0026298966|nr:DUF6602 domain-containing protein [uncultured Paracoccus sp.]
MINLSDVFAASETILSARIEQIRASLTHAGLKGGAVEEAVRNLLQDYLPQNIGIGSGVVVDSAGRQSNQIDIILYDAHKTPSFFRSGDAGIFPIECVYFAIEVKSSLSAATFLECEKNMESFKGLERTAYYPASGPISHSLEVFSGYPGSTWDPIYLVFALSTDVAHRTLITYLENHRKSRTDIRRQIDSVYAHGAGLLTNVTLVPPKSFRFNLTPDSKSLVGLIESHPLLTFFTLFSRYYNQVEIPLGFDFTKYSLPCISASPSCVMNTSPKNLAAIDEVNEIGGLFVL